MGNHTGPVDPPTYVRALWKWNYYASELWGSRPICQAICNVASDCPCAHTCRESVCTMEHTTNVTDIEKNECVAPSGTSSKSATSGTAIGIANEDNEALSSSSSQMATPTTATDIVNDDIVALSGTSPVSIFPFVVFCLSLVVATH